VINDCRIEVDENDFQLHSLLHGLFQKERLLSFWIGGKILQVI
jgi:hypothetical protein